MEEDTGKSLHVGGATGRIHGADYSLVDYNRAGIPLIEIVTKPIEGTGAQAPEVARAYVAAAARPAARRSACRDVRMEQGSLRCDANLSLRAEGPDGAARHPHRDQERQLAALGRARRPLRDQAPGRASSTGGRRDRAGDPALARGHRHHDVRAARRPTPRTTATSPSPTWCRSRRPRSGSRSCGRRCPSRRPSAARGCRRTGASPTSRCATSSNAGALDAGRGDGRRRRRRRRRPASGGSASSPGAPTSASVELGATRRHAGRRSRE